MASLAELFAESLSPQCANTFRQDDIQRALERKSMTSGFWMEILQTISKSNDENVRLAAAIFLKNQLSLRYELPRDIPDVDKNLLKQQLFHLSASSFPLLKKQLDEAIFIIAATDFPHKWEDGMKECSRFLGSGNCDRVTVGASFLRSLVRKYRFLPSYDDVKLEVKTILQVVQVTVLDVLNLAWNCLVAGQIQWFDALCDDIEILYCLHVTDLPEYFEDNMKKFLPLMTEMLKFYPTEYQSKGDCPSKLDEMHTTILELFALYITRDEVEVEPLVLQLTVAVEQFLMVKSLENRHNKVVSAGIGFLRSVAGGRWRNSPWNEQTLDRINNVAQHIILPNMRLRSEDLEEIEFNPMNFVRSHIDTNNDDTRRGSTFTLVQTLMQRYKPLFFGIFNNVVSSTLSNSSAVGIEREAAFNLLTSLMISKSTFYHGVVEVVDGIDPNSIFMGYLVCELSNSNSEFATINKLAALKFIIDFRNQLTNETHIHSIPLIIQNLKFPNEAVRAYAAHALECICEIKLPRMIQDRVSLTGPKRFANNKVVHSLIRNQALPQILNLIQDGENEYLPSALLSFILLCGSSGHLLEPLLQKVIQILIMLSSSNNNPAFSHLLFENLNILVREAYASGKGSMIESNLTNSCLRIITASNEKHDFTPYCYQVLAIVVENAKFVSNPNVLLELYQHCMAKERFQGSAAIAASLVSVLCAYMRNKESFSTVIDYCSHMFDYLTRFQQCFGHSRLRHPGGFELLDHIIFCFPFEYYKQYVIDLLKITLTEYAEAKQDPEFPTRMVIFLSMLTLKANGQTTMVQCLNSIQPGLASNVVSNIICKNANKVKTQVDRKLVLMAMSVYLKDSSIHEIRPSIRKACMSLLGLNSEDYNSRAISEVVEDEERNTLSKLQLEGFTQSFQKLSGGGLSAMKAQYVKNSAEFVQANLTGTLNHSDVCRILQALK